MPTEAVEQPDWLLGGRLKLLQPATGYRAGMDAVVLAASLEAQAGSTLVELGCGAGAALLAAAVRLPGVRLTGIERDGPSLAWCARNIALNAATDPSLPERVQVVEADVADLTRSLRSAWENRFDQAFLNPPFFDAARIPAVGEGRAHAYHDELGVEGWVKAALHCVVPGGRVSLIHRAHDLADILAALQRRAGEVQVLPIHSRAHEPAKRVLVRARKGLRPGPLTLWPPLVLFAGATGQEPSAAAAAIYAGEALDWGV